MDIFSFLQRGGPSAARAALPALGDGPHRGGLLYNIGRTLDWPRRKIWELVTGNPDLGGREALEQAGVLGPNTPGLDIGDVLGFIAEMAGDPLTYLGGVGALTRGGRAASQLGRLEKTLGALERMKLADAGDLARVAGYEKKIAPILKDLTRTKGALQEMGAPLQLGKTWREQGELGQRALFQFGIPWGPDLGRVAAPGALQALEKVVGGIKGLKPIQAISEKMSYRHGRLPETRHLYDIADEGLRESRLDAFGPGFVARKAELDDLVRARGGDPGVLAQLTETLEKRHKGLPEGQMGDIARRYGEQVDAMGLRETDLGTRREGALMAGADEDLSYWRRLATPEARQWLDSQPHMPPGLRQVRDALKTGSDIHRVPGFEGKTIREINELMQKHGAPKNFFFEDPNIALSFRMLEHGKKEHMGQLVNGLIEEFGTPMAREIPAASGGKVLYSGKYAPEGTERLIRADRVFPNLAREGLAEIGIPEKVAHEFARFEKLLTTQEATGWLKKVDKINSFFRALVTGPFPAYHIRNATTNMFMSGLAGRLNPTDYMKAMKEWVTPGMREQYERMGLLAGGAGREITGKGAQKTMHELVFSGEKKGLAKMATPEGVPLLGPVVRTGFDVGEFVEGVSRIAHYKAARRQGLSHQGALDDVRKYLFNYDELTPFERNKLRPLTFFYSWTRNAVPRVLSEFIEHTNRMGTITRGVTQPSVERGPMPEWLQETTALPVGKNQVGEDVYISGFGTPLEELNKLDISSGKQGLLGNIAEKIFSQASPIVRIPVELATDRDTFLKMQIPDADKAPEWMRYMPKGIQEAASVREDTLPSGAKRLRANPRLLHIIRNTPLSRFSQTIHKLADPRTSTPQKLLQTLTGVRLTSIDSTSQALKEVEDRIIEELEQARLRGEARVFKGYFAAGQEEEKNPEVRGLIQTLRRVKQAQAPLP